MIFKDMDSKEEEINILKRLIKQSKSEKQKLLILKDLEKLKNGYKSEKDDAYYLDFAFKDNKKVALLHDIRLEYKGRSAQFDHILITPISIIALESKSFNPKAILTINSDTSLAVHSGKFINSFPSPIEQNKRHLQVLKDFIDENIDIPNRIKLLGGIDYEQKVLINPNTNVSNKKLPDSFVRSDIFATERLKEIDNLSTSSILLKAGKLMNNDLVVEIARKLIISHKAIKYDYTKKYKIFVNKEVHSTEQMCPRCKEGKLVKRVRKNNNANSKYKSDEFLGCSRFPKCRYTREL